MFFTERWSTLVSRYLLQQPAARPARRRPDMEQLERRELLSVRPNLLAGLPEGMVALLHRQTPSAADHLAREIAGPQGQPAHLQHLHHSTHLPKPVADRPGAVARNFVFGNVSSAPLGYEAVPLVTYTPSRGFGWTKIDGMFSFDRGTADPLTRTSAWGSDSTFVVNVPNGPYDVRLTLGDADKTRTQVSVWLQGQSVATGITTVAGQFVSPHFTTTVTGGQLQLRLASLGGNHPHFALDTLQIQPLASLHRARGARRVHVQNSGYIRQPSAEEHWGGDSTAPKVTITGTPASGHSPEGTTIALGTKVTDPDPILQQKGFTYAWTVTKSGANFASGTTASPTFTPDDNAKYVVTVTATDKAGHRSAPATATIIVDNVAPTVAVTGAPDIAQAGTAVSLGSTVTDPSTVDTATGFTYAWSVTKNGAAFGTGTRANFTFTPDTAATYVVTLTATDKDGGAGTDSHTIQVGSGGSTAPTVTITGTPASGHSPEGTTIALGTKVTDPDPILQQKGFTYAWTVTKSGANFASGTTASPTFTPDDNATYVVAVTATDKAGHQSAPTTATIIVDNVAPTAMITGSPGQSTPGTLITLGSSVTDPSTVDTATGFTYTWNVTKNGAAFASGSTSGISFTPDTAATYVATLTVADKDGGVGTDQQTIFVGTITANGNLILLPPAELAQLRSEALANTPQWQAFKARLDQNLPKVLTISSYEGSELTWISDYALGYQVLMNIDPTTAANYADKALGLMKTGLSDYQVSSEESRILLARGDGSTTTFALPNPDLIPSSVMVYVGPVTTVAVVRGAPNTQDTLGSPFYKVLKVSNAPDGSPDYAQGTDWQRNPDLPADQIDWSLSGKEPAQGSTYYVTVAHDFQAVPVHFTLKGTTVTLATAPGTNQAVFTDYVYGTHSSNGSTLAYQETDAGDGGFNSIYRDTGYTSRYLGKHIAMGLDWLDGYVGFSSALKTQAINMLVRWSDYTRDHGYHANDPASNYGAGEYVSRVITALALANRSSQGPRLISEVLAYRQQNALPLFNNATTSLNGGFYDEGWNYGQLASENIILAGLALEDAGQIPQATAERHWASQVIEHLVSAQSTAASVYDGGDWYAYPSPFPGKSFMSILSNVADDPVAQSYANYILQNYSGKLNSDYRDMLYRNPSAPTSFWSALPLQDMAQGTGLLTARSDWGSSPVWVSAQFNNLLSSSHQPHTPGMMEINRGADQLLINGNAPGGNQDFRTQAQFANTVVVDDNGEGKQNYRYGMGVWYGTPGVTVNAYEANANDVYMYGDYHVAYSNNRNPGGGGSVSELTRQVVYLRPDYVVVYDRVTTLKDYYPKQLRWHFLNAPTVSGNSFVETAGSSKLFGQTFSMSSLTTTSALVKVQGATIQQIITQNSTNAQSVRYVTAFQVASSTTTSMVATQQILSTDLRMEGVQMADQVVLFGRNGDVDPATPETYQISGTAPVHHLLTNMQAGRTYQIMANGALVATVTASSQGTLSFTTTPSGTQTITVV